LRDQRFISRREAGQATTPPLLGLCFSFTECRPARVDWRVSASGLLMYWKAAEERTFNNLGP
jgi:hypothetical protein